ncbi:MAG: FAD-dependent oxidoreductase [Candidatus Binatia bacterium]
MSQVALTIDGAQVTARSGASLIEAARDAGIYIPGLCSHPSLPRARGKVGLPAVWRDGEIVRGATSGSMEFHGCGLCLVELGGELVPACSTSAREGLEVGSETPKVRAKRQDRMAKILADHPHACLICPNREGCDRIACSFNVPVPERCCAKFSNCELRRVADYIGIKSDTPRYVFRPLPVIRDDPLFTRDYNLCIGCTRCVRVCADVRGVGALGFAITDSRVEVGTVAPSLGGSGCKFCTACVEVCPTGALMDKPTEISVGPAKEETLVPCRAACPAGINVPRYVRLIAEGRCDEALAVIRENVPFPSVLGYVCFHPCESVCRRGRVSEPVSICRLKRFAAEHGRRHDQVAAVSNTGKKVAVVGSGPAGLTAAYYLRGKGHSVIVLEAASEPGGMLRHGIPQYRVPRQVVRREIDEILAGGIELRASTSVGPAHGLSLEKIRGQYDAVFLAVGAQMSKRIRVEGSELRGVLWGLDFLREVNLGLWPGAPLGRVVVIGGGNVAMDVALTARRLGAKGIEIACLESRSEMPAFEWEIEQACEEGAVLHPSWGPKRVLGTGNVAGIELVRCTRVFDESGRFNPSFDPLVTNVVEADTVILAIGQSTDFSFLGDDGRELMTERGTIRVDEATLATPFPGLFAGGEVVSGPSSVIQAIAAGRRAAVSIDRYLGGDGVITQVLASVRETDPWIGPDENFASWRRASIPCLSLTERQASFDPIEQGFDEIMAQREAKRCLRCDLRLQLGAPVLPPEPWLELDPAHVASVPRIEGVYQLLDAEKEIFRIAGTANLRQALEEQLRSNPMARYFIYEEASMYTQRESELLQRFLQEHGRLPSGNDLGDDLF